VNSLFDCAFGKVVPLSENGLISAFHFNSARYAETRGAVEEADVAIKKAEGAWPKNPRVLIHRALNLSETDPINAIDILKQVERPRREAQFYYALGRCQSILGNKNAAVACFDAGLRLDKTNEAILLAKSTVHLGAGTKDEHKKAETAAIQLIDILVEKRKDMSRNHRNASLHGKNLDEGYTAIDIIKIQKRLINGYILLGLTQIVQGKLEEARGVYDTALAIHTNDTNLKTMKTATLCMRAVRYAHTGQMAAAKSDAQAVLSFCKGISKEDYNINVGIMQVIATYVNNQDKKLASFEVGSNTLGMRFEIEGKEQPEELMDIRNLISNLLLGWSGEIISLTPQQVEEQILTPQKGRGFSISPEQSITELGRRILLKKNQSIVSGRIKFDALTKAMAYRKEDTANRLRIINSDLDKFEKSLLLSYLDYPSEYWVMLFVASGHQELMKKHGIPRSDRYKKKFAEIMERANPTQLGTQRVDGVDREIKTIRENELIEMARFGLGDKYAEECSRIAKLLYTNPLAIERPMLKLAATVAMRHLADEHNLKVQTERYVQLLDLPPTPENISIYLPKVREFCMAHIDLVWSISLIDPHHSKMG
jgi:tetratricopeptide (TPR) repeat protein